MLSPFVHKSKERKKLEHSLTANNRTSMANHYTDIGEASHSPSSELMKLVDINHLNDFDAVVQFFKAKLNAVITEVHGFDKLVIDNGVTQLNCPPSKSPTDIGQLLLHTLSESSDSNGITLRREFKVYQGKDGIEIREDISGKELKENHTTIRVS